MRHSESRAKNEQLEDLADTHKDASNNEFFAEALARLTRRTDRDGEVMIVGLLGQRDVPGALVRRAQALLRWDLRPSLWSHAFILPSSAAEDSSTAAIRLREVTLHSRTGAFPDPAYNGVLDATLGVYNDPRVDANVALLAIPVSERERDEVVYRAVEDANLDRLRYDLWQALGVWQTYLWSAGGAPNPLREGFPVASSAFVEYCFEGIQLDLAPAASERNSAPEHLWNTAVWWHQEFAEMGRPISGCFVLRDMNCTVLDPWELYRPGDRQSP